MKMVTDTFNFKSGGLHEKHVVATWKVGSHLSISTYFTTLQISVPLTRGYNIFSLSVSLS
jgi:hypothetical protein